jgi:hypothetical protein
MDADEIRLLKIEGRQNALAMAWLYLAAQMEMHGLLDSDSLEQALLAQHWNGAPFEPHAQKAMQHLVEQLADARVTRRQREVYRRTGHEE